jgi:cytosine/uracil/thiamine/allantoin permease
VKGNKAGEKCLETVSGSIQVEGISTVVLVQEPFIREVDDSNTTAGMNPIMVPIIVGIVAVVAIIAVSAIYVMKKRKAAGL